MTTETEMFGVSMTTVKHALGRMYIHRGKHLHKAKPITSGSRMNLILWCKAKMKK